MLTLRTSPEVFFPGRGLVIAISAQHLHGTSCGNYRDGRNTCAVLTLLSNRPPLSPGYPPATINVPFSVQLHPSSAIASLAQRWII